MKLIVGLGNPWDKYINTRHNIGFVAIDYFLQGIADFSYDNKIGGEVVKLDLPCIPSSQEGPKRKRSAGSGCPTKEGRVNKQKIYFLKPMEFMNKSGGAVQKLAHFYKIEAKNILVLHDEIDLPVWSVKYKFGWGLAGHNGLKDIANKLWTQDFWRIRIWVDRPTDKNQVADYVLSSFKKEEREKIVDQFSLVEDLIREFIER